MKPDAHNWLAAIREMTNTELLASQYLDMRRRFTSSVAGALTEGDNYCLHAVYGIWLEGHDSPIYIGQTMGAKRRLWDLPIGESHHLANSFPPEIWKRVVVVLWPSVMDDIVKTKIQSSLNVMGFESQQHMQAIGLGLEYLLQKEYFPLFNRRKKLRDGSWRQVLWDKSNSLGSRAAPALNHLFELVLEKWKELASYSPENGKVQFTLPWGRVVFPSALLHQSPRG